MRERIKEWHSLVVKGLVNGLSYNERGERLDDINFWRKRSNLFNEFSKCVLDLELEQNYEYSEKNLIDIANEGYSLELSKKNHSQQISKKRKI